jgi:hypothetical protein
MDPPPKLPAPPALPPTTPRAVIAAGGVLAGLGVAGLAAGYGLHAHAMTLKHSAEQGVAGSDEQREAQAEYDAWRLSPFLAGVAGGVLASAAVPMLLPRDPPRSTAAWVGGGLAGAAGVALIALGGVYLKKDGPLDQDGPLAGLLMATSAPLLTIPVTQLVRALRAPSALPRPTPVPTRAPPFQVY